MPQSKDFISIRLDQELKGGANQGRRAGAEVLVELRQAPARICLGPIPQGRLHAGLDLAARARPGQDRRVKLMQVQVTQQELKEIFDLGKTGCQPETEADRRAEVWSQGAPDPQDARGGRALRRVPHKEDEPSCHVEAGRCGLPWAEMGRRLQETLPGDDVLRSQGRRARRRSPMEGRLGQHRDRLRLGKVARMPQSVATATDLFQSAP